MYQTVYNTSRISNWCYRRYIHCVALCAVHHELLDKIRDCVVELLSKYSDLTHVMLNSVALSGQWWCA